MGPKINGGGRTQGNILVVDDDSSVLRLVSRTLQTRGYSVTCATTGKAALELASSSDFALVVLDLVMPDMDGLVTLREILAQRPDQAVLILSARTDIALKVRCLDEGAADYLTKPFSIEELVARVRARLRGAVPAHERFMHAADITLDLQRHVARVGGSDVALSTREFDLLLHLMQCVGSVCTREQLLAEVWNTPFDPHTNVVDVYIRRLRGKLGDEAIETLRNVGYALRVP